MPRLLLFPLLSLPSLALHASEANAPGLSTGNYVQATLALAFIVALLFGITWAARKVSGGKMFGQGNLKVISGIALGPRERIILVEVEDSWLVIGIIPGQIRTLHRLPRVQKDSAAGDEKIAEAPFADWLKSIRERRNHAS